MSRAIRDIFVTEHAGTSLRKLFLKGTPQNRILEPFFPGISFTRLGMSCYPTAVLSNKLAYFVQFLKENYPPPSDRILGHSVRSGTYFFRKIALLVIIQDITNSMVL